MKTTRTHKRKLRTRSKIFGTKAVPRLSVFRSKRFVYAQLIDDESGSTLASASSPRKPKGSEVVGAEIAKKAKKQSITNVIFDRGSYKYHGRVKAVAQAARAAGLKF